MRERILRRVLFPAPLRPMRPSTSPCLTSKLTSWSAQIVGTTPGLPDFSLRKKLPQAPYRRTRSLPQIVTQGHHRLPWLRSRISLIMNSTRMTTSPILSLASVPDASPRLIHCQMWKLLSH